MGYPDNYRSATAPDRASTRDESELERRASVNENARFILNAHTERYMRSLVDALSTHAPEVLHEGEFCRLEYTDPKQPSLGRRAVTIPLSEMIDLVVETVEEGVIYLDEEEI